MGARGLSAGALAVFCLGAALCGAAAAQEATLNSRDLDALSRIEASTRFYVAKCRTAGGAAFWREGRQSLVDPDIVEQARRIQADCRARAGALMQDLARRDRLSEQQVGDIFAGKLATDQRLVERRYGFVVGIYAETSASDTAEATAFSCQLFLEKVRRMAGMCR